MTDVIRPTAPCPRWSRETLHGAHEWPAPVDGVSQCPGWPPPALPAPGSPPATWYEGPYVAAAALRGWSQSVASGAELDRDALARDLRGAASVLDGVSGR